MGRPAKTEPSRQNLIVETAARVFVRDGYGAAAVDTIAREAGVSKATLYRHFDDKEALFAAVVQMRAKEAFERLAGAKLRGAPGTVLRRFARALLRELSAPATIGMFRLIISESGRSPALGKRFFEDVTTPTLQLLTEYLEQKARSGELRVRSARLSAFQFLGLLKEAAFWPLMLGQPSGMPAEKIIAAAVRSFLRAHAPG